MEFDLTDPSICIRLLKSSGATDVYDRCSAELRRRVLRAAGHDREEITGVGPVIDLL